jgi:hypothetical protein
MMAYGQPGSIQECCCLRQVSTLQCLAPRSSCSLRTSLKLQYAATLPAI